MITRITSGLAILLLVPVLSLGATKVVSPRAQQEAAIGNVPMLKTNAPVAAVPVPIISPLLATTNKVVVVKAQSPKAMALVAVAGNAMVIPPVIITNTVTLAWYTGFEVVSGSSGVAAYANMFIQAAKTPVGPWSNVMGFPMNGQWVTNSFTSTNREMFFRMAWNQ
jgi:hypothetical protein